MALVLMLWAILGVPFGLAVLAGLIWLVDEVAERGDTVLTD